MIKKDIEFLNKFKNELSTEYYNNIGNEYFLLEITPENAKHIIDSIGNLINSINKVEEILYEEN